MAKKVKILTIVGARPNFIKIVPLFEEFKKHKRINSVLVHTGQHYDFEMSQIFFRELKIPKPDYSLEVIAGSHGRQMGEMIIKLEPVILKESPDLVLVLGDVNSTLAGALTAAKLNIPLVHIEAGLRSFNKKMPEEINRILTDAISDYLFCPTQTAVSNLKNEGIVKGVHNVGDIMYDAFLQGMEVAKRKSRILEKLELKPKNYYLATIHRCGNTDDKKTLESIVAVFSKIENLVFPCHPRTEKYLKKYNLWEKLNKKAKVIKPVGYIDMLWLEKNARKILTDSGGVQKEAYFAKVPCITLREETEWVETVKDGWNVLVGSDKKKILEAVKSFEPRKPQGRHYGNGKAAKKIISILLRNI